MGNNAVITVDAISKRYALYDSPLNRLKEALHPLRKRYSRDFWALHNVSFTVARGEAVGIVGRNGSGKSTLLKIVSGVLTPSSGRVEVCGRILSLLELGTGFNPELTGIENIFFYGSIMGCSREYMKAKIDEIVAFADIGEFVYQPVKSYSSGMYVRLAFAVIANMDADILVIDEALAVGDAAFTQKCMRFIRSFREHGTLLFVSHDMAAVQNLCQKALWLEDGQVKAWGLATEVAEGYLKSSLQALYGDSVQLESIDKGDKAVDYDAGKEGRRIEVPGPLDYGSEAIAAVNLENAKGWRTGDAEVVSVCLENLSNPGMDIFKGGEDVCLFVEARANKFIEQPILGFLFRDRLGQDLFGENTLPFTLDHSVPVEPGQTIKGSFFFKLPMLPNGKYAVMASVAEGDLYKNIQHHFLHDALMVNVSSSKIRWGLVGIPFKRVLLEVIDE